MLTRRVKAAGPHWVVEVQRRNRWISEGVWAPSAAIAAARRSAEEDRSDPSYAKKKAADRVRREQKQAVYEHDFQAAVRKYLAFAPRYAAEAARLAAAVAAHATPVGSGTVARTQRIPVERRAEAAVTAWLRHQTTAYDDLSIPRVRGARREVRRDLAARSRLLLDQYRAGRDRPADCPLAAALAKLAAENGKCGTPAADAE